MTNCAGGEQIRSMFLEHVNLTVADVERSAAFYADVLDLHVRWKGELEGGRAAIHVGDERCYIALFEATRPGAVPYDYETPGINHFGFVVDDLDDAAARLRKLGVTPTGVSDYEPGRRLYFIDPDGHEVELVSYA